MNSFESFHEAYHHLTALLVKEGDRVPGPRSRTSVGSGFGTAERVTYEVISPTVRIRDPRNRLLPGTCRHTNRGFAFANYLWALTPGASADQVIAYNARGKAFTDDNGTLVCGLSQRLIGDGTTSPLRDLIALMRRDLSTRRAYLGFIHPADLRDEPRDFSCFGSLQFLHRDGRLDCIASMRSQSLIGVMPYDVVLLTMVQETVANELGLALGSYYHHCGSLHYYAGEEGQLRSVLSCADEVEAMPPMPARTPLGTDGALFAAERELRRTGLPDDTRLEPYWLDILASMRRALISDKG
ncbi:thymidylate synthase [Streptomyces sp. NPDC051162]|uniref:thymidylate synthase n=1 Tax=Streptomyces sp. NPDC051162 TaxID=3154747 RepID=UPI00342F277D